jgi:glycosyltransferase involved in cell wall biosynthesis
MSTGTNEIRTASADRPRAFDPLAVLVVSRSGAVRDAERRLLDLLDATERLRVEAVLLEDGPLVDELAHRGVPVAVVTAGARRRARARATRRLVGTIRTVRPDVVLAYGSSAATLALPAARLAAARAVWMDHDVARDGLSARVLAAIADLVITSSAARADGIGSNVVVIPPAGPGDVHRTADRVVAALAEAAGRPGAGLVPDQPVTVLTCVRNEQGHIDPVIGGVLPQLRPGDEYLVVDDGSTDATPDEIARWCAVDPRLRTIRGPGVNAAAARNRGIGAARHPVVACIDAGCAPAEGWLDAVRAPFAESSPPALVVGVYHVSARTPRECAFAAACFPDPGEARHPSLLVRAYGGLLGRAFSPDRLDGRSMAVRTDVWRAVGGFREDLVSLEDAAFSFDIIARGGRTVLATDADVRWDQHPTLRATARMYAKYGWGDASTGDRQLVVRDLARVLAYAGAPVLALLGGRPGRLAVAAGSAAYLSLPVVRAARSGGPGVVVRVPFVLAVKDLAKGAGCLVGLYSSSRR